MPTAMQKTNGNDHSRFPQMIDKEKHGKIKYFTISQSSLTNVTNI
jgi:hypothetical protein